MNDMPDHPPTTVRCWVGPNLCRPTPHGQSKKQLRTGRCGWSIGLNPLFDWGLNYKTWSGNVRADVPF
jgi:hypothetical protein